MVYIICFNWPKGKVIATYLSSDGQVRRATVQTASGIYERSAVSIAVLDVGVRTNTLQEVSSRIPGGSVDYAPSTSNAVQTLPETMHATPSAGQGIE